MPLDTEVDKQPSTMRTASDWMDGLATAVDSAFGLIKGSRGDSETSWPAGAGESFREMSTKAGPGVQETSNGFADFANTLRQFADQIDTVKTRMEQARELAISEGLTIQGFLIMEPGPEPPTPAALPADKPATPEQKSAHAAGTQAQMEFADQVNAYAGCAALVDDARKIEHGAVATLNRFIGGLVEKAPFNVSDVLTGLAGAVAGRTASLRAKATTIMSSGAIEVSERLMHNPVMSLKGQTQAAMIYIERTQQVRAYERGAIATKAAKFVDRLSPRVKNILQSTLDFRSVSDLAKVGGKGGFWHGAMRVGSKLPGVGLVITGTGVGYDVMQGKDPTTAAVSGVGGYLAGSYASAGLVAMGTPVGWVVAGGAVVGVGVGFAIEEWGDDAFNGAVEVGKKLEEINPKMTR